MEELIERGHKLYDEREKLMGVDENGVPIMRALERMVPVSYTHLAGDEGSGGAGRLCTRGLSLLLELRLLQAEDIGIKRRKSLGKALADARSYSVDIPRCV